MLHSMLCAAIEKESVLLFKKLMMENVKSDQFSVDIFKKLSCQIWIIDTPQNTVLRELYKATKYVLTISDVQLGE